MAVAPLSPTLLLLRLFMKMKYAVAITIIIAKTSICTRYAYSNVWRLSVVPTLTSSLPWLNVHVHVYPDTTVLAWNRPIKLNYTYLERIPFKADAIAVAPSSSISLRLRLHVHTKKTQQDTDCMWWIWTSGVAKGGPDHPHSSIQCATIIEQAFTTADDKHTG